MNSFTTQRNGLTLICVLACLCLCFQVVKAQGPNAEPAPSVTVKIDPLPKETPNPAAVQAATPTAVEVRTTATSEAKPTLPHPVPNKPETIPSENQPGIKPTPEDPAVKKARDDAATSYFTAVKQGNEAILAQYEHNKWALKNREAALLYQQWAGKIIFIVVLLLVFVGVAFSGIQFFISLNRVKKARGSESSDLTTIEASWQGFKMSSSILGVIILGISLLFFYLYLAIVFEITVVSE
jgi:hypothetical protein